MLYLSKQEKLIARLKTIPKDFTFDEMKSLLFSLGFQLSNKGKTSGSRVQFVNDKIVIGFHKPHDNGNIMKEYQLKQIVATLEMEGLI